MTMPNPNPRGLEERLRNCDRTEPPYRMLNLMLQAADALAAKDKLLVEARQSLTDAIPALERLHSMTPGGPRRSIILGKLRSARTTLANLETGMEK